MVTEEHASDADETSKRRLFDGVHAHFRPPVLTMPDARDGCRQNSQLPNEPPAWVETDTAVIQDGRMH